MNTAVKNPDNIQAVDIHRHGKLRVRTNHGFPHAQQQHVAVITMTELASSISNFPVVVIKRPEDGRYVLATMLGLQDGENVYWGPEYWESAYVPLVIRRYPFALGYDDRANSSGMLTTCIDISSPSLSETAGTPLFNGEGLPSDMLNGVHRLLADVYEDEKHTDQFTQTLAAMGLLRPMDILLQLQNSEVRKITGLMSIDEEKMLQLSAEQLKELHTSNYLHACYLISVSMHQLTRLIRLRNQKGAVDQIVDFRLDFGQKTAA